MKKSMWRCKNWCRDFVFWLCAKNTNHMWNQNNYGTNHLDENYFLLNGYMKVAEILEIETCWNVFRTIEIIMLCTDFWAMKRKERFLFADPISICIYSVIPKLYSVHTKKKSLLPRATVIYMCTKPTIIHTTSFSHHRTKINKSPMNKNWIFKLA